MLKLGSYSRENLRNLVVINIKRAIQIHTEKMKKEAFFLGRQVKDYGTPRLSKRFFDKNPFKELSAARMAYSILLTPGVEQLGTKLVGRFIRRGKEEAKRIRREKNPEKDYEHGPLLALYEFKNKFDL